MIITILKLLVSEGEINLKPNCQDNDPKIPGFRIKFILNLYLIYRPQILFQLHDGDFLVVNIISSKSIKLYDK